MTHKKLGTHGVTILSGLGVVAAFGVGYFLMRPGHKSEPAAPDVEVVPVASSIPSPALAPEPPPVAAPIAPPAPPAPTVATIIPTESKVEDPASWNLMDAGCIIDQTGSKIAIVGTNVPEGWGHGNGITYKKYIPEGDFFCSVDFMVPKFAGIGSKLVYLRPHSVDGTGKMFAILFTPGASYSLQGWAAPNSSTSGSGSVRAFGDEDHVFHRMKIKYDSTAKMGYGWVDDKYIGSIRYTLADSIKFEMFANTATPGMQIDLRFENFTCTSDTSAAPPIPVGNVAAPAMPNGRNSVAPAPPRDLP